MWIIKRKIYSVCDTKKSVKNRKTNWKSKEKLTGNRKSFKFWIQQSKKRGMFLIYNPRKQFISVFYYECVGNVQIFYNWLHTEEIIYYTGFIY